MEFAQTLISVLVGAGIGAFGSFWISRVERDDLARAHLRQALGAYSADLTLVVARLREMPDVDGVTRTQRAFDLLRGEKATWVSEQRAVVSLLGPDWRYPIERLVRSTSELRLMDLPEPLSAAITAAEDYTEALSERRTPELLAGWPDVQRCVETASQSALKTPSAIARLTGRARIR